MQKKNRVTMQMIADKLGITKVSVSKAINNQPGVGSNLKKKVLATAREMGYDADAKTARLAAKRFELFIPKRFFLESDRFYTVIYYAISKHCKEQGIRLSLNVIGNSEEMMLTLPAVCFDDPPDGIFLCGELTAEYTATVLGLNIPAICIDFCHPGLPVDSIVIDNYYAAFCATNYLLTQGHQQIGFVGDISHTHSILDRYLGYTKALHLKGLPVVEAYHVVNNDRAGRYDPQHPLPSPLPSAFLCHCDMAAYHLAMRLKAEGIPLPEQVSLLSFDNTDLCKRCVPALTTVDINKEQLAKAAFDRLLKRFNHPDAPGSRFVLETSLIIRDSIRFIETPESNQ